MAESVVKVWLSDEIVGSAKNTTILNKLSIGPSSINLLSVADSNKDGATFKCSQQVTAGYIYDKKIMMSAKPTITIKGTTFVDKRSMMGTTNGMKYSGTAVSATAGEGVLGYRWTGEGNSLNRFWTPKTACLSPLPLNQILDNRDITLNQQTETFKPTQGLINAFAHMASEKQKEGKAHGDFTVDPYDRYDYYASPFPQIGHTCPNPPADVVMNAKVQYPYGYDINQNIEGYNVIEERHVKLPKYTTRFYEGTDTANELEKRTIEGIELPFKGGNFYYGPLVEVITFEEPILEPVIHPFLKFRDDPSKLFLDNLTEFVFNASMSTTASRVVRFSFGDQTVQPPTGALYQYSTAVGDTPTIVNPIPQPTGGVSLIPPSNISSVSSVSIDMINSDFKLYMIQYTVSPLIERRPTSVIPFHKYDIRNAQDSNLTAGNNSVKFETKNIGSVPYYMLLYGVYNADQRSNVKPDRRVRINGIEIGLGENEAVFSRRFDRNQLIEMTQANGLHYNFRTKRNAPTVKNYQSFYTANALSNGIMMTVNNGTVGNNIGYLVNQSSNFGQDAYDAPQFRDVPPAGDFVLLNFTNDICAMTQSLASGTMCNLPFNLEVDYTTTEAGSITIYCYLVNKYELRLDRINNNSSIKQELFTATQVLDGVKTVNGKSVNVVDDLLIGGNLFSTVKNNFQRWLPKIRDLYNTGKQLHGAYKDARATYDEHMKPHVDNARAIMASSGNENVRSLGDRLNKLGLP